MSEKSDDEFDLDVVLGPLIADKEIMFSSVQSLFDISKAVGTNSAVLTEFEIRLREIHETRIKFRNTVKEINQLNLRYKPKYKSNYQEILTFDQLYFNILSVAEQNCVDRKNIVHAGPAAATGLDNSKSKSNDVRAVKARLPELNLFHFDSKLENWPTFHDTFSSLIHDRGDISNIEKFYYLISTISGSAQTLVKSMPVTSDNYPIIWNLLVKRYENKRVLATSYLEKLFQFKPLQSESVSGLNTFLQTFQENVKALELLNISDLSGFLLFYISIRNLDPTTRREFELRIDQDEIPDFTQLIKFLEKHVRVLEMSESKVQSNKGQSSFSKQYSKPVNSNVQSHSKSQSQKPCLSAVSVDKSNEVKDNIYKNSKSNLCLFCSKPHSIYKCYEYGNLSPPQRLTKVNELKLCTNCLREHPLSDCSSKIRCSLCKQMHHHTLHLDSGTSDNVNQHQTQNQVVALTCSSNSTVILGTALVQVANCWGQYHTIRAVIDSGAMSSYITNDCAKRLGLSRRKCTFEPIGLGGAPVQDFGLVTCSIKPRNRSGPVLKTETVIVTQITGNLPTMNLSKKIVDEFKHLDLADNNYCTAAPIELLLAGDIFPYIYDGQKILPREHGLPIALHSIFGYIIAGQTVLDTDSGSSVCSSLLSTNNGIENIMSSFWETENISCDVPKNPEDVYVEQLFSTEHTRDSTGRYIVRYPFKPEFELGDSRPQAVRRFINLESKLNRLPDLKDEYCKFMSEYEAMGHMTCMGELGTVDSEYIIPHFCILRPSSTTTKLRAVFDASSKTSNDCSLNSVLYAGPKLQADINEILTNFRLHKICLSSDICKMFRMILIDEAQRKYQHILWRYSQDQPIKVYELNTVTYGVASSPYLSIRVLHQLADDEAEKYPVASKILKKAFFVDDLLWSVSTLDEAIQLQDELIALLNAGGFLLRKWSSNCPQLLERVPADHRETPVEFQDDKDLSIKVLGLQWMPAEDVFSFTTTAPSSTAITMRSVLSQIGRQFDPLGFVAPCIFHAKCIMQKLWILKLGWDDRLPTDLEKEWLTYVSELPHLSNFRYERQATVKQHSYYQILGFCDASMLGYAALVYLRSLNDAGDIKVSLIIAKSKVAPLKTRSIPRLELLAALLLAKLVTYTLSILMDQIPIHDVFLFTDSSVVLSWLNTPAYKLTTYVATRVTKILDDVSNESWFHVSGACNPADVASRGALPSALLAMPEWLSGPEWLYAPHEDWPIKSIEHFKSENVPELKSVTLIQSCQQTESNPIYDLTKKYSSFTKLQRVIARCYQFVNNCRTSRDKRNTKSPSLTDLIKAHDSLIKIVQREHFSNDIEMLAKGNNCGPTLRKLNPFLDPLGFLRVGGRLSESSLPYQKKHPLLLPKKCNFTKILINHYHKIYLHVGPRSLQSLLNQKYWIISARGVIRSVISKCISCFKVRPSNLQPIMAPLPKFRSADIHVFHTVGVDMAGPFYTKESNRRNAKISKAYLCLFVCFSTRAVYLEVVSALTTECFLAAFDRFSARRGLCHTLVSDNGKNFVSAGRQLAEIIQFFKLNSDQLTTEFNFREVQWKYNPPTGSHFGGMYESGIKSAKQHLKRVIGTKALSFEELTTLFARVEAVLNSRPLCSLSSDPREFEALTPGHFLVGRELLAVPEYPLTDEPAYSLTRWQLVQQASQQFWKLWRKDYLHTLQQRQKWLSKCRDIQVGELVLIHSDAPPLQWHLGRVTQLYPGPDGTVRVVRVRTRTGEFTRPVVKLSPLPSGSDSESDQ